MGHREQLLEAAKRCLAEKGYERTTARDLVAASNTNLASIGYHFGSKEALLTEAMVEVLGDWGDEVGRALSSTTANGPRERLEAMWTALIESFKANRGIWLASFEVGGVAERVPELKHQLAEANQAARVGLTALFLDIPEAEVDPGDARTMGSFLAAVIPGLFSQWATGASDRVPTGADMARGLAQIMEVITQSEPPSIPVDPRPMPAPPPTAHT